MSTKSGGAVTTPSMDPATIGNFTAEQVLAATHTITRHARDADDGALLLEMCGLTPATEEASR